MSQPAVAHKTIVTVAKAMAAYVRRSESITIVDEVILACKESKTGNAAFLSAMTDLRKELAK